MGGNTAVNLAALAPASVAAVGVVGCDWRASVLMKVLEERGVGASGVIRWPGRVTSV